MNLLRELLRQSWPALIASAIAGLIAGFGSTGLLALINRALQREGQNVAELVLRFAGLCAIVLVSGIISEILLVRLGQESVYRLRMDLSRRILATPWQHLQRLGAHRLLATLTEDIAAIVTAYEIVPILCINGAIVLGCFLYLGWLSWQLLLLVLFCFAMGVGSFRLVQGRALASLQRARENSDQLYKDFRALTEGGKELKMHRPRRHAFLRDQLGRSARAIRDQFNQGMSTYVVATHWGNLLFYVVIGLVLFALPNALTLSREALTGYTLTILFMMTPLAPIMHALPELGRGFIAIKKIEALSLNVAEITDAHEGLAPAAKANAPCSLALRGITHRYRHDQDEEHFTLGPIDLLIPPGELVFITGGNGSGKTTLALLVLGLYVPEQGVILINRNPVTDADREHYRQLFAPVFFDAFLFEGLLGLENHAWEPKARELLIRLHLDRKVHIENGRFSTLDLSQGQRKRLALLSAILDDRPFYVFDEWAADQDPIFRNIFYTELLPQLRAQGKTVIVITHDDRYYPLADRRIHLEAGQIVQDSSRDSFGSEGAAPRAKAFPTSRLH